MAALLTAVLACVIVPRNGAAQDTGGEVLDQVRSFALVGTPLAEALNLVIDRTRISLVFESGLAEGRRSFCRIRTDRQDEILRCVLRGTGLDYVRTSSGMYVLFSERSAKPLFGSLSGSVVDAESGEPVVGASVLLTDGGLGTATTGGGQFVFGKLKPGPYDVTVTHVAYRRQTARVNVPPGAGERVLVAVHPRTIAAGPIVVDDLRVGLSAGDAAYDGVIGTELVEVAGFADVMSSAGSIPGVQSFDGLGEVHVQAGAAGEHQFLLDGASIFVPVPNGGLIGSFSPFAIRQVTVQKGGFGAGRGSYLSGVVSIDQMVAPPDGRPLAVRVDPFSVNGRASAKGSFGTRLSVAGTIAGRHSMWDVYEPGAARTLFDSWGRPDDFLAQALFDAYTGGAGVLDAVVQTPPEVTFSDIHGSARATLDGFHSLFVSYYRGRNTFGDDLARQDTDAVGGDHLAEEYAWLNTARQVRYEDVLSDRAFARAAAWSSSYEFAHPFERAPFSLNGNGDTTATQPDDFNDLDELGLELGVDISIASRHFVSAGAQYTKIVGDFALSLDPSGSTPPVTGESRRADGRTVSFFIEDRVTVGARAVLTVGGRTSYLTRSRRTFFEPRLAFAYDVGEPDGSRWSLRAAAGLYRQFVNQVDVTTYSTTALVPSVRYWLPLSVEESPSRAYHVVGSVRYTPTPAWRFGVESFYKHYPHLLVVDYGIVAAGTAVRTPGATQPLISGKGFAYGISSTAGHSFRKLRLDARYEYTVARRSTPGRFASRTLDVPWNVPHLLALTAEASVNEHISMTLKWQGAFGRSWGLRQAYYDYLEPLAERGLFDAGLLSDPENDVLPALSQLDASARFTYDVGRARLRTQIGVLNLLDRRNVRDWSLREDPVTGALQKISREILPLFPYVSLEVSL